MRKLLPLIGLSVLAAGCASTATSTGSTAATANAPKAMCEAASSEDQRAVYANAAAFSKKVMEHEGAPLESMKAVCALNHVQCKEGVIITTTAPTMSHDLSFTSPQGALVHFGQVFMSSAGAGCAWEPTWNIEHGGAYTVVTQEGQSWSRENNECHDEGFAFMGAIIETATAQLVATFSCAGTNEGTAGLGVEDGQVAFTNCDGKDVSSSIAQLKACNTKK